ncbi:hypothetical protein E5Q_01616 [Mixia osmundae IAM 14324]|uniref:Hypervirulence associated protein TUDOR domain-containing protein n=1 Tax=Mixia osmundae (strain CBS 9802 / IAM 14324 / JCM 22182 / KY 12970) TaxID=764103 RepID=G7DWK1_MIXOS|nr:hypothetical protein E5Q_01616 [Mixia osmundae IAM 14324]
MAENTNIDKGDKVSWNWGSGQPSGKVESINAETTTVESKRGNEIKKKGTEDDPAVHIKQGQNNAYFLVRLHCSTPCARRLMGVVHDLLVGLTSELDA